MQHTTMQESAYYPPSPIDTASSVSKTGKNNKKTNDGKNHSQDNSAFLASLTHTSTQKIKPKSKPKERRAPSTSLVRATIVERREQRQIQTSQKQQRIQARPDDLFLEPFFDERDEEHNTPVTSREISAPQQQASSVEIGVKEAIMPGSSKSEIKSLAKNVITRNQATNFAQPVQEAKRKIVKHALYLLECQILQEVPLDLKHFYEFIKTMAFAFNYSRLMRAKKLIKGPESRTNTSKTFCPGMIHLNAELLNLNHIKTSQTELAKWLAADVIDLIKRNSHYYFRNEDVEALQKHQTLNLLPLARNNEMNSLPIKEYFSHEHTNLMEHIKLRETIAADTFIIWLEIQIIPFINLLNEIICFPYHWHFDKCLQPQEVRDALTMVLLVISDYCTATRRHSLLKLQHKDKTKIDTIIDFMQKCAGLRDKLLNDIFDPKEDEFNEILFWGRTLNREKLDPSINHFLSFMQPTKRECSSNCVSIKLPQL